MGDEDNEMGEEELKDIMSLYLLKKRSAGDPYLDNYYNDGMNGIKSKLFVMSIPPIFTEHFRIVSLVLKTVPIILSF